MNSSRTLYERLGGYDAVYAFTEYLIAKLMARDEVGQIWQHMAEDRVKVEIQNFVDFVSSHGGGRRSIAAAT
jgi:hemoglobin